jgi:hypothetical protein
MPQLTFDWDLEKSSNELASMTLGEQSTTLKLLCADGILIATFTPLLSAEQYSELLRLAE